MTMHNARSTAIIGHKLIYLADIKFVYILKEIIIVFKLYA